MESKSLINLRRLYLCGLYAMAAIAGVRAALLPPERLSTDVFFSLTTGMVLALLIAVDARIIGKPLPRTASWLVFFFWPVAAPACVIALRKLRGVWLVLGHVILLFIVYVIVAGGTSWLAA